MLPSAERPQDRCATPRKGDKPTKPLSLTAQRLPHRTREEVEIRAHHRQTWPEVPGKKPDVYSIERKRLPICPSTIR